MQKFDRSNIFARALARLNNNSKWQAVTNESVISSIIKTNAEMNAEVARYAEYLFRESRWDYAQNESSIMAQANMLGYRPRRATCASGKIEFVDKSSLVDIPLGGDSSGMDFVIKGVNDDGTAIAYQGRLKEVVLSNSDIMSSYTESKLDPYVYIPVIIQKCDDASTSSTKSFFKIESSTDGTVWKEWKVASTTLFNNNTDRYVEVYNDVYSYNLFYLKFNNDPNRGDYLPMTDSGLRIRITYLETLGADGNIGVTGRTFKFGTFLATNVEPISGGQNAETIEDLKRSAPRYYLRSYTTGTKHAYQEAIKNIGFTFGEGTSVSYPMNVIVWGSKEKDTSGSQVPITCISFVAPNLEDWASNIDITNPDPYASINKQMREYLDDLKAPQDILKFVMPNYVPFALNTKIKVSKDNSIDVTSLRDSARAIVSDLWGSDSTSIDFNRDFYPTEIIKEVSALSPSIKSVEIGIEALTRVEWQSSKRVLPNTNNIIHTIRVPFDFDKVFKDGMQGINKVDGYSIRVDLMYRKPNGYDSSLDNSVSIFGATDYQKVGNPSGKKFYVMKDNGSINPTVNKLWSPSTMTDADYSMVKNDVYKVTNAYQYRFKNSSMTDEDYDNLNKDTLSLADGLVTYEGTGVMPSYLIYYSDDNNVTANGRVGNGSFIEFSFDGLWELLAGYGLVDSSNCPLDTLKCSTLANESDTAFRNFIALLDQYVECVVSMKPISTSGLVIRSLNEDDTDSTVLYVDNKDSDLTGTTNLTPLKRVRMNTVTVERI